jgi:acylglycerol lipase
MGHSMGGGQALSYVFRPDSPYNQSSQAASRPNFAGVLLYSPLIAIHPSSRPSKLTVAAGRIVAKLIPHKQRYSPLDVNLVSRNEATVKDFMDDELCHDTGTFEGLAGMLDRGIWLEGMFEGGDWVKSDLPFWFGHGDGDRITSHTATEDFVKGLQKKGGDVKFETYERAYHRLNAELPETSAKFIADVRDWVLGKAPGTGNLGVQVEARNAEAQSEPTLDTADHGDGVAADVSADDKAKL